MTKTSTPNDVIRYVYGEVTSSTEMKNIENAIASSNMLSDFYMEIIAAKCSLEKLKREPSNSCLKNILDFSRSYKLPSLTN